MKKTCIINGITAQQSEYLSFIPVLREALGGATEEVKLFNLDQYSLQPCVGCFSCWVKTPGSCIFKDDWEAIIQEILSADHLILLAPSSFGSFSSGLKVLIDRFIPLVLPYFRINQGEIHHKARYKKFPRVTSLALQTGKNLQENEIFKILTSRNAANFYFTSFVGEVLNLEDPNSWSKDRLKEILSRKDQKTSKENFLKTLALKENGGSFPLPEQNRRVLSLIGSPKKGKSTSEILVKSLISGFDSEHWHHENLKLSDCVDSPEGRDRLLEQVRAADLIIFSAPLYVDALPAQALKALEIIAQDSQSRETKKRALVSVLNNGFPEAYQNLTAAAIIAEFCRQQGYIQAGTLLFGAGEALSGGEPLETSTKRGMMPLHKQKAALERAGKALSEGRTIDKSIYEEVSASPLPGRMSAFWPALFKTAANGHWKNWAKKNGLAAKQILNKPYAR